MKNANFIAIDFETATPKRMPCQIGIAVVKNGVIVDRIERYIQPPGNKYSNRCIAIHGITPERTKDEPTFDIIWDDIKDYFEANFIIAHNKAFDLDVLQRVLAFYNIPGPIFMGSACTYELTGYSLKDAAKVYNIELPEHHNAVYDAECCAKIFLKYLSGECQSVKDQYIEQNDSIEVCVNKSDPLAELTDEVISNLPLLFDGLRFIITGITMFNRDNAYRIIKKLGGKKASISNLLDYAVLGEAPGPSKIENINRLNREGANIKVISDLDFLNLIIEKINTYVDSLENNKYTKRDGL